jgi:hypothetical protein
VLTNQTAIHGVPAAINAASTALLRTLTANASAAIGVSSHPLPTLPQEVSVRVGQMSGAMAVYLSIYLPSLPQEVCMRVAQMSGAAAAYLST